LVYGVANPLTGPPTLVGVYIAMVLPELTTQEAKSELKNRDLYEMKVNRMVCIS